ncbi:hypothetical protein LINPERHAP1_LOCUS7907, partial [Linum perenne]
AIRDYEGKCIGAFSTNLGQCSITRTKIRGIVEGMKLVWDKGIQKIVVQTNSFTAIQIIQKVDNHDHQHASLMFQFLEPLTTKLGGEYQAYLQRKQHPCGPSCQ